MLNTKSFNEVYYDLLHEEYKLTDRQSIAEVLPIESVLSHSLDGDRFVSFGNNSFFFGLCEAYAHHRPVVLSPDVIWILISQGFAHHINADSERFRDMIVAFHLSRCKVRQMIGGRSGERRWLWKNTIWHGGQNA